MANAAAATANAVPQIASIFGAGADVVATNPVWATLASVLDEVSAGFRLTGVPPEEEIFLRVVEHLGDLVKALALNPNDPALLAEYQEMSVFLAAHPDSDALSEFIATHPAIVPAVASVLGPSGDASTGWVVPLMGGVVIGSLYRAWLDSYVSRAAQKAKASCVVAGDAAPAPLVVNLRWATLAKVLNEVSTGFRLTGVPPEKESFLRVVEHLGQVVNGLALAPTDPALLAEFQELSVFLSSHPDSNALATFIATHPAIVSVVAPVPLVSAVDW